jgi:hypothetical protein
VQALFGLGVMLLRQSHSTSESSAERLIPCLRWCSIDGENSKFILGDVYGKLALLSLEHLQNLGLVLVPLGEVSNYCSAIRPHTHYFTVSSRYLLRCLSRT